MPRSTVRYCAYRFSGIHELQLLVDGEVGGDGGTLAFLGVLPSGRTVAEVVRERLAIAGK